MTLATPDSTLTAIRLKVRRLTASPSEQSLTTDTIDQAINTFYQSDFPYAIKLDQMRSVYTFYTSPNVERYPINVNFNQGIRSPVYFEGIQGYFFKDRQEFYNMWPRWPTLSTPFTGDGVNNFFTFTNQSAPFLPNEVVIGGLDTNNNVVKISDDGQGNLIINQAFPQISVPNLTNTNQGNSALVPEPFPDATTIYSQNILPPATTDPAAALVPGTVNIWFDKGLGNETKYVDDASGNMTKLYGPFGFGSGSVNYATGVVTINFGGIGIPGTGVPVTANFFYISTVFYPGMVNKNTGNPGDNTKYKVGSVNYVTGDCVVDLTLVGITPASGSEFQMWVSQYQPGRPYSLLFWNNELTIRPVPDKVYKVEVETYLTPVQFLETSDNPILNQWWQYLAYGAAMEIQRERNDFDAVDQLREGFMRQEGLVLERQGVEEIGQRNTTIFSATVQSGGWNQGNGWPY
jgi:hypothetical protein